MQIKLLATAAIAAILFTTSLAGTTSQTAQEQRPGDVLKGLTPPPGGAMFAPNKARTITLRQNGAVFGTFAVPEGVAMTIQSSGALTRPSGSTKWLFMASGTGEIRFLRSPFASEDSPASISFRNADITIE
jgi:hypothetical protein